MKTTKLIIASAVFSFAAVGAAYADSNSPRPGFNKGSQFNIEWLTRTNNSRSDVDSSSQIPASSQPLAITRQPTGPSSTGQPTGKPMFGGYKEHNHNGSVMEH